MDLFDSEALHPRYVGAAPFPHIAVDNFLPAERYRALSAAFPGPEADLWFQFRSGKENKKLQSRDHDALPPVIRDFIADANGPDFIRFLENLTGIDGLIADPDLHGGGLHQTLPGGHLGMHVDYNFHSVTKLDRRLNVILYLNDEWDEAWGGSLEFWDEDVRSKVQSIAPVGNRLVVFNTDEKSWHGHPDPLRCPDGITRKSIALYYYTKGRPVTEAAPEHNTIFKERPGEAFRSTLKEKLRDWVPPGVRRLVRPPTTDS